jgi:hypothetical protein
MAGAPRRAPTARRPYLVLSIIEARARICVVSYEKSRRKLIASDGECVPLRSADEL